MFIRSTRNLNSYTKVIIPQVCLKILAQSLFMDLSRSLLIGFIDIYIASHPDPAWLLSNVSFERAPNFPGIEY